MTGTINALKKIVWPAGILVHCRGVKNNR